jgi:hypothetical protein
MCNDVSLSIFGGITIFEIFDIEMIDDYDTYIIDMLSNMLIKDKLIYLPCSHDNARMYKIKHKIPYELSKIFFFNKLS